MDIKSMAEKLNDRVIEIRRDFHMHPELSYQEERTSAKIAEILRAEGIEVHENVGGKRGVVGYIRGAKPGKTVALRADFDALPITEDNALPFRSQNVGVMHACGHDAHASIALGTAMLLNSIKDQICGTVKMVFQSAEESAPTGGAKYMIADGVLDDVDAIFGLHVWPSVPTGKIGFRYGGLMASSDPFVINVTGKASHASQPENGIDCVVIASQIVNNLQSIVARQIGPQDAAVVTVGEMTAGTRYNVIAGSAILKGTVRTLDNEVREKIPGRIEAIVKGVCDAYGAKGELDYKFGYPALINVSEMVDIAREASVEQLGEDCVLNVDKSALGAEDFAYYLQKKPGAFLWLGCTAEGQEFYPVHNPNFILDENCLKLGVTAMASTALKFLGC